MNRIVFTLFLSIIFMSCVQTNGFSVHEIAEVKVNKYCEEKCATVFRVTYSSRYGSIFTDDFLTYDGALDFCKSSENCRYLDEK